MMKGQKGITLVALIITIIVMLILVGVSISVALNGGLFDKARTAKDETNQKQLEEVISVVLSDYYADKQIKGTAYVAPTLEAFKTEVNKTLRDATVETHGSTGAWFKVTYQGKIVYVNITDFTQTTVEPASV